MCVRSSWVRSCVFFFLFPKKITVDRLTNTLESCQLPFALWLIYRLRSVLHLIRFIYQHTHEQRNTKKKKKFGNVDDVKKGVAHRARACNNPCVVSNQIKHEIVSERATESKRGDIEKQSKKWEGTRWLLLLRKCI